MKTVKNSLLLIALYLLISTCYSNNVIISNVTLTGQNTTLDYTMVKFDISWENSWRTNVGPANWDAAWIFVKYRKKNTTPWYHATLNWVNGTGTGDGHIVPANAVISSSNDNGSGGAYGVFIYHNTNMTQGPVNYTNVQLRWNYGVDNLLDDDSVEVCVFAIEMVYVPQGSFHLGSGGTENNHFYQYPTSTSTYTVSSENAITMGTTAGNLYFSGSSAAGSPGNLPAAYPKGFNAFYCMKYEISHQQYVDFLNKLLPAQAASRVYTGSSYRHSISGSWSAYTTARPYVAINYLSKNDILAYLDWAALRPMTELEYEKACRGTIPATPDEFAWGTIFSANATGIIAANAANERPSPSTANTTYGNTTGGPLRVGCFGIGTNTREATGGSFYGIMELSGNLWEQVITAGRPEGRAYIPNHGDGLLTSTGIYNVTGWPNYLGLGVRGGDWINANIYSRVSDRFDAAYAAGINSRYNNFGGRGVRTAP